MTATSCYDNALAGVGDAGAAAFALFNLNTRWPDRRERRSAETRLRIIWATRQSLLDSANDPGERQLPKLKDIAECAGKCVRTVFQHFADKRALFTEVLSDTEFASRAGAAWMQNAGIVELPPPEQASDYAIRVSEWYEATRPAMARLCLSMALAAT